MGVLDGKVAIVTGAGSGIGRAIALGLVIGATSQMVAACSGSVEPSTSRIFQPLVTITTGWRLTVDTATEAIFVPLEDDDPNGIILFLYPKEVFDPSNNGRVNDAPADMLDWLKNHRLLTVTEETSATVGPYSGTKLRVEHKNLLFFPLFATSNQEYRIRFNGSAVVYLLTVNDRQMLVYVAPEDASEAEEFVKNASTALHDAEFGQD